MGSTIKGVSVGGRNLWLNSSVLKNHYSVESSAGDGAQIYFSSKRIYSDRKWSKGDIFTVQAKSNKPWASAHMTSTNNNLVGFWVYYCKTLEMAKGNAYTYAYFVKGDGKSTELKATLEYLHDDAPYISFRWNTYSTGTTYTYEIWDLKLETGNQATDWTPAPEDVDTDITNAQAVGEKAQSNLDAITSGLTDGTIQEAINKASQTVQGNLDTANATLSAVQTSANTSIKQVEVQYCGNNSSSVAPSKTDSGWKPSVPTYAKGDTVYCWQRVAYTLNDGTTHCTDPVNITAGVQSSLVAMKQVFVADGTGAKVYRQANSADYLGMQSDGIHIYINNTEIAKYTSSGAYNVNMQTNKLQFCSSDGTKTKGQGVVCTVDPYGTDLEVIGFFKE